MRLLAVAAVAAVASFGAGVAVGALPTPREADAASSATLAEGAGSQKAADAVASDRSEAGAQATAMAYATASQDWLYLDDEGIERSVRVIATAAAGAALARDTVADMRAARQALAASAGRVWWIVRPLAARVEHFEPSGARVVVWTVSVLSAAEVALPQADWTRVTVDLAWTDGGWRLQAIADTPGPTPMTGTRDRPWQPEALDEALRGFEPVSSGGQRP